MSLNNKIISREKSSKKVSRFLEENRIHKKDFAQMIGVTLSYIYNLIDENIPFSSRGTTLERIATVMDVLPEEFEEYIIHEDGMAYDKNVEKIKEQLKKKNMTTIDFLKHFERKKRLFLVDMLRGVKPIPADFYELYNMLSVIGMENEDIFALWCNVTEKYLNLYGFNSKENHVLLNSMFQCAKKILNI